MKINNPPNDTDLIKEFYQVKVGETFCLFGSNELFLKTERISHFRAGVKIIYFSCLNLNKMIFSEFEEFTKVKMVQSELTCKFISTLQKEDRDPA